MRYSISTTVATVLSLLSRASYVSAQQGGDPATGLHLNTLVPQGCFGSSQGLTDQGSYGFQSKGYCQTVCVKLNKPVMATQNKAHCWCGDLYPPLNTNNSNSCNTPCNGIDTETCGGQQAWSVYSTGMTNDIGSADGSGPSQSSNQPSPTPTPSPSQPPNGNNNNGPSSIVKAVSTVFVSAPGSTSAHVIYTTQVAAPAGPNKAVIAAGVVVGVVGALAVIGAILFFLRQRRRKAVEDEYRRNAAINGLTNGGKAPSQSSISDSRLEPSVMMQRRMSDGSIMDNQDYSRRILKVTNPDGH